MDLCGQESLTISSGSSHTIVSPLYPAHYPNNFMCTWYVTSLDSGRPAIEFITFKTELPYDVLEIGEGKVMVLNTTLIKLSGFSAPKKVVSREPDMWLRFKSDFGTNDKGFSLRVFSVDSDVNACEPMHYQCPSVIVCLEMNQICDTVKQCLDGIDETDCDYCQSGLITVPDTTTVNLTSPLYPTNYPVNLECIWYVIADTQHRSIGVSFVEFHTEWGFDDLTIGYGVNVSLDSSVIALTGSELISNLPSYANLQSILVLPNSIITKNQPMWLKFTSDRGKTYVGFHAIIWSSTKEDCDSSETQCDSSEYSICYDGSKKCDGIHQCLKDKSDEKDCGYCGANKIFLQESLTHNLPSANFPQTYPSDLHCSWAVETTGEGFRVLVKIIEFQLERGYDFLIVDDVIDNERHEVTNIARLTGGVKVTKIASVYGQVNMEFVTDRTGGDKGFHLELTQVEHKDGYCEANEFTCGGSICTSIDAKCDGFNDCGNLRDEQTCDNIMCPGSYLCDRASGDVFQMCVPVDLICDGARDCPEADDETHCDEKRCPEECHCVYENSILRVSCVHGWNTQTLQLVAKTTNALTLSGGNISTLRPGLLKGFAFLKSLSLSNNSIEEILPRAFDGLGNLTWFDISRNKLRILRSRIFEELVVLHELFIFDNPTEIIQTDAFEGLSMVKYMVLIRNKDDLQTIYVEHGAFDGLENLETVYVDDHRMCCRFPYVEDCITLEPQPPLFMCGSLMQNVILRASMWVLGLSALIGNLFSIIWRFHQKTRSNTQAVQGYLIASLAASDFLMGVYMIIIASADLYFGDVYFIYSDSWRASRMCRFAGFMCLLSSESSVFFLTLISVDRLQSVVTPMSTARLTLRSTKMVSVVLWLMAFVISLVPSLMAGPDSDFYDLSDVCVGLPLITRPASYTVVDDTAHAVSDSLSFALPVAADSKPAWFFSIAIFLGLNLVCFICILLCYVTVFISLKITGKKFKRKRKRQEEIKMAIRMAVIVGTDFCCWMPVIIMGLLSQTGAAVIPLEMYTWSVVFILPINSSLNPYLYTIQSLISNRHHQVGVSTMGNSSTNPSQVQENAQMSRVQHTTNE
ncbi:uncharacterized protein [Amphiura filiformis]|uniref:uncharacterized protein n=1 Tax=Amphiura filiformis TaxID=82378 RepID=UPI003B222D30